MNIIRVALETQFAAGTPTGLGVYAMRLAQALRQRRDVEIVELRDLHYDVWRFDRRLYWDQVRAPLLARRARADVVHFTGGTLPFFTPHPSVLTLHDLAWLHNAAAGRLHSQWYFGAMQRRFARRADRIATDTQTSRNDIIERLGVDPSRVAVTGAGVDETWFRLERRPQRPPYFLSVGTVEMRKDLETAVRAVASLPDVKLVNVGPHTKYAAKVKRLASQLGVSDRFELRGYVDEATLHALYAGASALIFPSQYEGFGLPPLQALAARLSVVAADIPVLREVLGECALWARPGDPRSFAEALQVALVSDANVRGMIERGQMRAREFTWASVAERIVRLYRSLLPSDS